MTPATPLTEKTPPADAPLRPLLVDINRLAVLLGRSVASLERDQSAGRLPAPLRIGGSKKWRLSDIQAWVAAGCPARTTRKAK